MAGPLGHLALPTPQDLVLHGHLLPLRARLKMSGNSRDVSLWFIRSKSF